MNTRVLWVLMWKHAVVRLRRFIHTTVEIVSPLLFFLLLFFLQHILIDAIKNLVPSPEGNMETTPIQDMKPRPYWLMYTPESELTNSLMADVGVKLNLKRLDSNPGLEERGYFPFAKGFQLVDIASKMKTTHALLIFNDMSEETWPARLNYTIRMKGDFHTEEEGLQDKTPSRPQRTFIYEYGTFMVIQWAVDTSYIKLLTGNEIPQNLSLQAFPYYDNNNNFGVAVFCKFLIIVCWLSLMLTFVFHMSRLLQERTSGIQELMKMVGVSLNALGLCHFLNVLPIGVIFATGGTIVCKVTDKPMVPETNGLIIFLMLLFYFNSVIALAFVCSYISRGTQYAVTLSALTYAVSWLPTRYLADRDMKYKWRLLTGLLPHIPMNWFWTEVSVLELSGQGANFSNITKRQSILYPSILVGFCFMLLQSLICYVLTWYLSLVRPGQYGQALPWNFLFKRKPNEKKKLDKSQKGEYEMSESEFSILSTENYRTPYYEVRTVSQRVGRRSDYTITEDTLSEYWSSRGEGPDEDEEDLISLDSTFFEPGPAHTEAGIKVVNVSKVYPKHKALNKVSLEVYKGEITVLLGHNGAGKTTLMSIITGMTSATEGIVFVNGKDTVKQKSEVRKNLGFCPQHNLFFEDLTLRQHIMFFTMLKRGSHSEARQSARKLAHRLGITDKLNSLTRELSGGMKRRAQLACALAGGADVLVLDEPTSGLDVETRRDLWDLLLVLVAGTTVQSWTAAIDLLRFPHLRSMADKFATTSLRGERTVLLTTHFMEEADALGDRVAALSGGVLKCFATPMHLKKAVGTGYRLSLTTMGMPKVEAITEEVTSHVPDTTLKEQTNNSLSYNLPAAQSGKFSKLFSALEAKRSKLGIDSIGIGVSTLEEVFLKLCSEIDTSLYEDDDVDNDKEPKLPPDRLKGISLYMRQLYVLLKRQVKYTIHKKWVFLFLQLIVPITIICLVTKLMNNQNSLRVPRALPMNLDQFNPPNFVLYRLEGPHVTLEDVIKLQLKWLSKGIFLKTDDVAKTVLQVSKRSSVEYMLYLAGVEVDNLGFKVLSTTMRRHAAPVTLNLLSNMLAAHYIPSSDGNSIITINDPIGREISAASVKEPKDMMSVLTWGLCLIFVILATNIINISLPCKERLTGARHIHIMSGCPVELHWLATLSFHMTLCTLGLIVPTVLAANYLDRDNTFNQADMLGTLALILFLGCMAFLAFSYLVSLHFGERGASIILVVTVIIFVVITASTKTLIEVTEQDEKINFKERLEYFILIITSYTATPHVITETALRCLHVGRINAWCDLAREHCPSLFIYSRAFNVEKCCAGEKPRCYFCIDKYSPGQGMILLLVHFLVFMTLVIMTERRIFNGIIDKVMNMRYNTKQPAEQDDMVRAEKDYVSRAINLPAERIPDAMLVDDLHKNYVQFCRKNVNAIKGVSFSVKKGECFGLLGVNGAGKSTCFKMITAEECPTRGNIFGNGYLLRRGNSQYLKTLGYCPQFFGLDMFQTGEENLAMVLTLRGFDEQHVKEEVQNWIQIVGLEKYARQRVEGYSGGCVRRLGTASALCGGAELALLDEPSAGVDVAARRRLWTALRRALRRQRAVVITSHSMDEMEALCSRIAILAGGRVRALGTAAALRAAHAQGHAVVFKVKHAVQGNDVDDAKVLVNKLKSQLKEMFNCTLKDEHKTMLHYHINETIPYSTLFAELEALREGYPDLIEDYTVTETTLEEVFLAFAKEQRTNRRQAV